MFRDSKTLKGLLSECPAGRLEEMAAEAHALTLKNFGWTIQLYTPIYLANYCENECLYCGFSSRNDIERKALKPSEVEEEARIVSSSGLRHVLILTGESRKMSPPSFIRESVKILRKYFDSISIEIYPLEESEYAQLVDEGVDGLTIYQEVYDEAIYRKVHPAGPKNDYRFRLEAPERGARAGMRFINIGALLGLNDWREEAYRLGLHAKYLQDKFPDVEIGIAVPRLKPHAGLFDAPFEVGDKDVVQMVTALRIFLPRIGIALSTREDPAFRENLMALGVTRMSAGSSTRVGGRITKPAGKHDEPQFEISDRRGVEEMIAVLNARGYQAVLKDWVRP